MDTSLAMLAIKALDGLSARAVATAQNIANANTANYRPLRVTFEQTLQKAAATGDDAVASVHPQLQSAPAATPDGELRLDLELATAASTAGRYAAVIEMLSRETQLQALAITGST